MGPKPLLILDVLWAGMFASTTHPHMQMSSFGSYIHRGIKISTPWFLYPDLALLLSFSITEVCYLIFISKVIYICLLLRYIRLHIHVYFKLIDSSIIFHFTVLTKFVEITAVTAPRPTGIYMFSFSHLANCWVTILLTNRTITISSSWLLLAIFTLRFCSFWCVHSHHFHFKLGSARTTSGML